MSIQLFNRRELAFQLYEVQKADQLVKRPLYKDHSRETFDAILEVAEKLAVDLFAPHSMDLDKDEPFIKDGVVHIREEVKRAYEAFSEAGFFTGRVAFSDGGMQLPEMIMTASMGYFTAANPSTTAYMFLTTGATNLIRKFASDRLKEQFIPPLSSGQFSGTMALTEPDAGSSLSDIKTQAAPNQDGTYNIKGSKLYISAGEHELTENIVHLVLARIKGAPAGVRGISLFLVPKKRIKDNGEIGELNGIALAGLIHKLGYRGTTSTALSFGGDGETIGYLIGEKHQGLKYMFQMMNEARLAVGFGAVSIGSQGYQYSLDYAKQRVQGRLPSSSDPNSPSVAIIHHADIKRMLLAQKSYVEGGYALCMYAASLIDDMASHEKSEQCERAELLLDLLTPIVKAWPSEYCTKANDLAIQVLGGAGYTREYPVEQYWRDNRLNLIHEGTNGIQALDLLARKVFANQGQALVLLREEIQHDIDSCPEGCLAFSKALSDAVTLLDDTVKILMQAVSQKGIDFVLANASGFLNLMGHTVVAWMWLRMAKCSMMALPQASEADKLFYEGKLQAAKYFFRWELPLIERDAKVLQSLDDTCFTADPAGF